MDEAEGRSPVPAKPKVLMLMGATGSGKHRLAIDLAQVFPDEILNADSMQVCHKVPVGDLKGVPHHLLGTIPPNVEFTAWKFRDIAIPIIDDILSRNLLPIIVGGTNFYIQALLFPFLIDESAEEMDDLEHDVSFDFCAGIGGDDIHLSSYDILGALYPVASKRIHPNDKRKINNYLRLYSGSGILPSKHLQGRASEGRIRAEPVSFGMIAAFYA